MEENEPEKLIKQLELRDNAAEKNTHTHTQK